MLLFEPIHAKSFTERTPLIACGANGRAASWRGRRPR